MAFNDFFAQMVLPFLLVFVVVFAILQKSKILGDGKRQVDAMAALVIGLITIGLPISRNFIIDFLPWVGIGIAVLLVFFILYGFVAGDLSNMDKKMKIAFGIIAGVFTVAVIFYVTGWWKWFGSAFGSGSQDTWFTIFLIALVIGAGVWVVFGADKDKDK